MFKSVLRVCPPHHTTPHHTTPHHTTPHHTTPHHTTPHHTTPHTTPCTRQHTILRTHHTQAHTAAHSRTQPHTDAHRHTQIHTNKHQHNSQPARLVPIASRRFSAQLKKIHLCLKSQSSLLFMLNFEYNYFTNLIEKGQKENRIYVV
jgi:hypothetical protein